MNTFNRIRFYCGIGLDRESRIVSGAAIASAKDYATSRFAGVTFTQGQGAWRDESGQLVAEDCLIIETIVGDEAAAPGYVKETAIGLRERLHQSCVLVTSEPIRAEFI